MLATRKPIAGALSRERTNAANAADPFVACPSAHDLMRTG